MPDVPGMPGMPGMPGVPGVGVVVPDMLKGSDGMVVVDAFWRGLLTRKWDFSDD